MLLRQQFTDDMVLCLCCRKSRLDESVAQLYNFAQIQQHAPYSL